MAQVTYSFEGGTSGNSVALGHAAAGDTDFDVAPNIGTNATNAYDNAHAAHGGLANKIATGVTSTTAYNAWTTSIGTQATVWVRAYLFFTAAPAVQHRVINFVGAAASRGNVLATTGGTLIFTNAAGGTVLTSAAFPTGAWFRLEAMFTGSATVGQWEYKIWNSPDSSGTPDDTQTSAANLATGGTCDTYRFGIGTAIASAGPYWLDDVGVSTTGYIGPATAPAAVASPARPGRTWLRRYHHRQIPQFAAAAPAVAAAAPVPPQRPQIISRSPSRARIGRAGLCAAGIAVVVPLGAPQPTRPPPPAPHITKRAHIGPAGACGAGVAVIIPRGTPGPRWRPQPRRPASARAVWRGVAGPQPAAMAVQAYQRPPPQARRPAPSRAVTRRNAGLVNPAPVTQAIARPLPQPRSPAPRRAVWRGNAVRIPLGTLARRPGPQITSKPRSRVLWRGGAGTLAPGITPPPRWRPLSSRRIGRRAVLRRGAGLVNALPPAFQVACSTPTVTTTVTSASTATDPRDGAAAVTPLVTGTYTAAYTAVYTGAGQVQSAPAVTDPQDGTATVTAAATSSPSAG